MARRKLNPSKRKTFSAHVELYNKVFRASLNQLPAAVQTETKEDDISALLLRILQQLCKQWSLKHNAEIPAPIAQLPIQNAIKAIQASLNSLPKPDFTCPIFDAAEGENIYFDIECKVLGKPSSPSWKYNENYVADGISRFDSLNHEYGNGVHAGLMVGYLNGTMKSKDVLQEVNQCQQKHLPNNPSLSFSFNNAVSKHKQQLHRQNLTPIDFELGHMWVKL